MDLRSQRKALAISQSRLARISSVSRFKICLFELDEGSLTSEEQERIRKAILEEAERLRSVSVHFDFAQPDTGIAGPTTHA
jgi:predicted transcriptional regulator